MPQVRVRRPGDVADFQLADRVAGELRTSGFSVESRDHRGQTIDGERDLRLVIAERSGSSSQRIVVVAHRYAAEPGAHYVLVSTREENETEFRSYRIVDGVITEEEVKIVQAYESA